MRLFEPDQEFLTQFNIIGDRVKAAQLSSDVVGDVKMESYYRGMWRGLEMAQEAYWTCWRITDRDQVEVNGAMYFSEGKLTPPSSGGSGDLP